MGDAATRQGRGSLRIHGGDVVRMPLVLGLVQMSNFQIPSDDGLDYLQSRFHISGSKLTFEQIAMLSRSVSITGAGTITWPAMALDLKFNSRSASRLPLWTDLMEALRNELVTATVGGTLSKPTVSAEPLHTTRRLLGSIFGGAAPEMAAEEGTEESARKERQRLKSIPARAPVARRTARAGKR